MRIRTGSCSLPTPPPCGGGNALVLESSCLFVAWSAEYSHLPSVESLPWRPSSTTGWAGGLSGYAWATVFIQPVLIRTGLAALPELSIPAQALLCLVIQLSHKALSQKKKKKKKLSHKGGRNRRDKTSFHV